MRNSLFRLLAATLLLALLVAAPLAAAPAEYAWQGRLVGLDWASRSELFALVYEDGKGAYRLDILRTEPSFALVSSAALPSGFEPRGLAWDRDDEAIHLVGFFGDDAERGEDYALLLHDPAKGSFLRAPIAYPASFHEIWGLDIDPTTGMAATLSSGEGHPDVLVSRAGSTIYQTGVYPGSVVLVAFRGGWLYLYADVDLRAGPNPAAALRPGQSPDGLVGPPRLYKVDPLGGKGELLAIPPEDIAFSSASGRWYLKIVEDETGFSLKVY